MRTKLSEIEISSSPENAVREEAISSTCSHLSSPLSVNWSTLAKQLNGVLEKAVHARVIRAPNLSSSTHVQEASANTSSTSLGSGQKSESESVLGMECRHSQCEDQPACGEELIAKKGDPDKIIRGRARIAILFSGGVDSMLLAALTDR